MTIRRFSLVAVLALALVPAAALAQTPPAPQTPSTQQTPPATQTAKPTLDQIKHDTPQDALIPFFGFNGGGSLFGTSNVTGDLSAMPMSYGASLLFWGPGILAGELDFGYNPSFYKDLDVVSPGASSNMYTLTANFVLGPTFFMGEKMRLRPYALVGGGLMRSTITEFITINPLNISDTRNQGVVDIAGGLYFYPIRRLGFRGDFRYFMGIGANSSSDGWGAIEGWNYYRATLGVALAF
jgi:hypothetical protein